MTATINAVIARRVAKRFTAANTAQVLGASLLRGLREQLDTTRDEAMHERIAKSLQLRASVMWPSAKYQLSPSLFACEVLGIRLTEHQQWILESVRKHPRVAVASGHKIGKSTAAAACALWFYATHDDARVVMSSVTSRQVDSILWREIRKLFTRALIPMDGEIHELARSGLKSPDLREITGFTAKEPEAMQGISGDRLLYILDEASGIGDDIWHAIDGNRAGDAHVLLLSNPTRTEGFFFDAFHGSKYSKDNPKGWVCRNISSEESPNVIARRKVVPGLCTHDWVEEKQREWGVDSTLYKVRVKGEFVLASEDSIVQLADIIDAQERWNEIQDQRQEMAKMLGDKRMPSEGRLTIGIDVAGHTGMGDETVFAVRRGNRILELLPYLGLSIADHLTYLLGIITSRRLDGEIPRVVLDREGSLGFDVKKEFEYYLGQFRSLEQPFDLVLMRASDKALRNPDLYDRQRDELWGNMAKWIRSANKDGVGGAIPSDTKLMEELHAHKWWMPSQNYRRQTLKATSKRWIKKQLGRSPDRADAVCLAVWDPTPYDVRAIARGDNKQVDDMYVEQIAPHQAVNAMLPGGARAPRHSMSHDNYPW